MPRSMTRDLTEGKPLKLILSFAAPLLFGGLFQQFYSFVDTAIVGRYLGAEKLAAVGATGSVNFLVIGLCLGFCSGFRSRSPRRSARRTSMKCAGASGTQRCSVPG